MTPIAVLIKLHHGYGLGDAVQMTSVIRHVAKNRPDWIIDYVADRGRHSAMHGLVRNAFAYDDSPPCSHYDREIDIHLYDTFAAWPDRPNTRVTQCLHERFGMAWDKELAGYVINVTEESRASAFAFMLTVKGHWEKTQKNFPVVCIQYQGDSSAERKNLTHDHALGICQHVIALGRVPLLIDWRNKSPLTDIGAGIHTTGRLGTSLQWGADAQMNAAIISQCEAYVGIDSGPGKCASATETPALICWTGHHPALFHDPCPNTTHLVPADHREMPLLQGNRAVADFFEENYNWRVYDATDRSIRSLASVTIEEIPYYQTGGHMNRRIVGNLVDEVKTWLTETLK